jgi:hypothetical protein
MEAPLWGLLFSGEAMIPADLSFHDATIAAIEREEASTILHIEDVAVDHGEDVVNGTLTLDGVRRVLRDGEEIPELAMAGDDGEILELEELPGPVIRMFVIWTKYETQDEAQNLYLIECKGMRWEAEE